MVIVPAIQNNNLGDNVFNHPPLNGVITRHHIIPRYDMAVLGREWLASWNGVIECNEIVAVLQEHLDNVNVNYGELGGINDILQVVHFLMNTEVQVAEDLKMANFNPQNFRGDINQIPQQIGMYWEQFDQIFAWIPGNLVVGPQNRANDPGNVFDEEALNHSSFNEQSRNSIMNDFGDRYRTENQMLRLLLNLLDNGIHMNNWN